uniref:Prenyl (decaprenyl) diphosphate synthase, subunit 1 n=1 Tax=Eptatretus burgeri TaxID=7764 RepID=A0A8C4N705_EPTBU
MHVSAAPLRSTYKSKEGFSDDALQLIHADLQSLCLREITHYYFDGKGKAFRPTLVLLMARSCNATCGNSREVTMAQRTIARIAEMIHTASLIHDDIIDQADTRRGKLAASRIWGERKAILAGDFILSTASVALARLGNEHVISMVAQVVEDLVRGEFMQLGSKENENERFAHYLLKTFKKTASLMAHSCKAVGNASSPIFSTVLFYYYVTILLT